MVIAGHRASGLLAVVLAFLVISPVFGSIEVAASPSGPRMECDGMPTDESYLVCRRMVAIAGSSTLENLDPCIGAMMQTARIDDPACPPVDPAAAAVAHALLATLWYLPPDLLACDPEQVVFGPADNSTAAWECEGLVTEAGNVVANALAEMLLQAPAAVGCLERLQSGALAAGDTRTDAFCRDIQSTLAIGPHLIGPFLGLALQEKRNCETSYLDGGNNTVYVGCNRYLAEAILAESVSFLVRLQQFALEAWGACSTLGSGRAESAKMLPGDELVCAMLAWSVGAAARQGTVGPAVVWAQAYECAAIASRHQSNGSMEQGDAYVRCGDDARHVLRALMVAGSLGGTMTLDGMQALASCVEDDDVTQSGTWTPTSPGPSYSYDYSAMNPACKAAWGSTVQALELWESIQRDLADTLYDFRHANRAVFNNTAGDDQPDQFEGTRSEPQEGTFEYDPPIRLANRTLTQFLARPNIFLGDETRPNDLVCVESPETVRKVPLDAVTITGPDLSQIPDPWPFDEQPPVDPLPDREEPALPVIEEPYCYERGDPLPPVKGDPESTELEPWEESAAERAFDLAAPFLIRDAINDLFLDDTARQPRYKPLLELTPSESRLMETLERVQSCLPPVLEHVDGMVPGGLESPSVLPDVWFEGGLPRYDLTRTWDAITGAYESFDLDATLGTVIGGAECVLERDLGEVVGLLNRTAQPFEPLTEFAFDLVDAIVEDIPDTLDALDPKGLVANVTALLGDPTGFLNTTLSLLEELQAELLELTELPDLDVTALPAQLLNLLVPRTRHPQFMYDTVAGSPLAGHWDLVAAADAGATDLSGGRLRPIAVADALTANLYTNRTGTERIVRIPMGVRTCVQLDASTTTRDASGCDLYATLSMKAESATKGTLMVDPNALANPDTYPTVILESALPGQAYPLEAYGYLQVPNKPYVVAIGYDTRALSGTPVPDYLNVTLQGFHKASPDNHQTLASVELRDARDPMPLTFVAAGFEVRIAEDGKPKTGSNETSLRGHSPRMPGHATFGFTLATDETLGRTSTMHLQTGGILDGTFLYRDDTGELQSLASVEVEGLPAGQARMQVQRTPVGSLQANWLAAGVTDRLDARFQRLDGGVGTLGWSIDAEEVPAAALWSAVDQGNFQFQADAAADRLGFVLTAEGVTCGSGNATARSLWLERRDGDLCAAGEAGGLTSLQVTTLPAAYRVQATSAPGRTDSIEVVTEPDRLRQVVVHTPPETWTLDVSDGSEAAPSVQWTASGVAGGLGMQAPLAFAPDAIVAMVGDDVPAAFSAVLEAAAGRAAFEASAPWGRLAGFMTATGNAAFAPATTDYVRLHTTGDAEAPAPELAWDLVDAAAFAAELRPDGTLAFDGEFAAPHAVEVAVVTGDIAFSADATDLDGTFGFTMRDGTGRRSVQADYTGTVAGADLVLETALPDGSAVLEAVDLPLTLQVEADLMAMHTKAVASAAVGSLDFRYAPPGGYPSPIDSPANWVAMRGGSEEAARGVALDLAGIVTIDARQDGPLTVLDVAFATPADVQVAADNGVLVQAVTVHDAGGHYELLEQAGLLRWTSDQPATDFDVAVSDEGPRYLVAHATGATPSVQATWTARSADNFEATIRHDTGALLPWFYLEESHALPSGGAAAMGGWIFDGEDLPAQVLLHARPGHGFVQGRALTATGAPADTGRILATVADRTDQLLLPPAFAGDSFWLRDTDAALVASLYSNNMRSLELQLYVGADRATGQYGMAVTRSLATGLYVDAKSETWDADTIVNAAHAPTSLTMKFRPGLAGADGFGFEAAGSGAWTDVSSSLRTGSRRLQVDTIGATPASYDLGWLPQQAFEVHASAPIEVGFQWAKVGIPAPWLAGTDDFLTVRPVPGDAPDWAAGGRLTGAVDFAADPTARTITFEGSLAVRPFALDYLDHEIKTLVEASDLPDGLAVAWNEAGRSYSLATAQATAEFGFGTYLIEGSGARLYVRLEDVAVGTTAYDQDPDGIKFAFSSPAALDRITLSSDSAGSGPLQALAQDGIEYRRDGRNPLYLRLAGIRAASVTMPEQARTDAVLDHTGGGTPVPSYIQLDVPQQAIRARLDSVASSLVHLTWPTPTQQQEYSFVAGGLGGQGLLMNYASGETKAELEIAESAPAWFYWSKTDGTTEYQSAATRSALVFPPDMASPPAFSMSMSSSSASSMSMSPASSGFGSSSTGLGGALHPAENVRGRSNQVGNGVRVDVHPMPDRMRVDVSDDFTTGTVELSHVADDVYVTTQPANVASSAGQQPLVLRQGNGFVTIQALCGTSGAKDLQAELHGVDKVTWDLGTCSDQEDGIYKLDLEITGDGTETRPVKVEVINPDMRMSTNIKEGLAQLMCYKLRAYLPPDESSDSGWRLEYCAKDKPFEYHWNDVALHGRIDLTVEDGPASATLQAYPARYGGQPQLSYVASDPTAKLDMRTVWKRALSTQMQSSMVAGLYTSGGVGVPTRLAATYENPTSTVADWDMEVSTQGTGKVGRADLRFHPNSPDLTQCDPAVLRVFVELRAACMEIGGYNFERAALELDPPSPSQPSSVTYNSRPASAQAQVRVNVLSARETILGTFLWPSSELTIRTTPAALADEAKVEVISAGGPMTELDWQDTVVASGQVLHAKMEGLLGSATVLVRGLEPTRFKLTNAGMGGFTFDTEAGGRHIDVSIRSPAPTVELAIRKGACKPSVESFAGAVRSSGGLSGRSVVHVHDLSAESSSKVPRSGHGVGAYCTQDDDNGSGPALAFAMEVPRFDHIAWGLPIDYAGAFSVPAIEECNAGYRMTFAGGGGVGIMEVTHDVSGGSSPESSAKMVRLSGTATGGSGAAQLAVQLDPQGFVQHTLGGSMVSLTETFDRSLCMEFIQPIEPLTLKAQTIPATTFKVEAGQRALATELSSGAPHSGWPGGVDKWRSYAPDSGKYSTVIVTTAAKIGRLELDLPLTKTGRHSHDEIQIIARGATGFLDVHAYDLEGDSMGVRTSHDGIRVVSNPDGYDMRASYTDTTSVQVAAIRQCGHDNKLALHLKYATSAKELRDDFDLGSSCDRQGLRMYNLGTETWFHADQVGGDLMDYAIDVGSTTSKPTVVAYNRQLCFQGGATCRTESDTVYATAFHQIPSGKMYARLDKVVSADGASPKGNMDIHTATDKLGGFFFTKTQFMGAPGTSTSPGYKLAKFVDVKHQMSWDMGCGNVPYMKGTTRGIWLGIEYFRMSGEGGCRKINLAPDGNSGPAIRLFMGAPVFEVRWEPKDLSAECNAFAHEQGKRWAARWGKEGAWYAVKENHWEATGKAAASGAVEAAKWSRFGWQVALARGAWEAAKTYAEEQAKAAAKGGAIGAGMGYAAGQQANKDHCEKFAKENGIAMMAKVTGMGCVNGGEVQLDFLSLAKKKGSLVDSLNKNAWKTGTLSGAIPPPSSYCPKPVTLTPLPVPPLSDKAKCAIRFALSPSPFGC